MTKETNYEIGKMILIIPILALFIVTYFSFFDNIVGLGFGLNCKWDTWWDKDKYCNKECTGYWCNTSSATYSYVLRSHKQDKLDEDGRERNRKAIEDYYKSIQDCWNKGKDYEYNFSIFENYNLSCKKIAYLNDHLIDKVSQMDGGYIKGSYHGFFSSGHVEGHLYQYVVTGVLATGQLPKKVKYHLDCNNQTTYETTDEFGYIQQVNSLQIDYFSESEFVMEYVNKCIKEEEK